VADAAEGPSLLAPVLVVVVPVRLSLATVLVCSCGLCLPGRLPEVERRPQGATHERLQFKVQWSIAVAGKDEHSRLSES
jgi:hypothetical protein